MKPSLVILLFFFIVGCTSLELSTDYDESIDFSSFKTYRWHSKNEHNEASLKYLDQIMDQRIRSAIDAQLQQQNFIKIESGTADFWVNYSVIVKEKVDIKTYNNYNGMYPGYRYRYGYGYYGSGMGVGLNSTSNTQVTYYNQGTLIIDILKPTNDQLMWRGAADGRLPKNTNRKENDSLVKKYVSTVLSQFPPKD